MADNEKDFTVGDEWELSDVVSVAVLSGLIPGTGRFARAILGAGYRRAEKPSEEWELRDACAELAGPLGPDRGPSRSLRSSEDRLILERVRTDDGGYRVFEPRGVGTGFLTYDPVIGDTGTVTFDRVNRPEFDAEHEAAICGRMLERGGDAAVFGRLEHLYLRLIGREV